MPSSYYHLETWKLFSRYTQFIDLQLYCYKTLDPSHNKEGIWTVCYKIQGIFGMT